MLQIKTMNWQYISGFFDADGSIGLYKQKSKNQKSAVLVFHNNDKELLEQIRSFIYHQTGVSGSLSTKKSSTYQNSYDLQYLYRNAVEVCKHINSAHKEKNHKLAVLLQYYQAVTPRNGKYNERLLQKKRAFERLFYWSSVS